MQIKPDQRVPTDRSYISLYQETIAGNHAVFSPLHHKLRNTESITKIVKLALGSAHSTGVVTEYMVTLASGGYNWCPNQLFEYCTLFSYYSSFKNEKHRKPLVETFVDKLVLAVNNSFSPAVIKTAYDELKMLDIHDDLIDKTIYLDKNRVSIFKEEKIEIIEIPEENYAPNWAMLPAAIRIIN